MKLFMKFLISVREIRQEISLLKKLKLKRHRKNGSEKNSKMIKLIASDIDGTLVKDGTLVIDVMTAMIHQRYTISEI